MPRKKKSSAFYVTRDNDTPRVIGKLFGLDFQDIVAWNKPRFPALTAKSKFHAGTSVAIRAPGHEGASTSSNSHSKSQSKSSPTAGKAGGGTKPKGQGNATADSVRRKRKKSDARKDRKKKARPTSSATPFPPATFPQLQTYLSKPGQSLETISHLLCVDKTMIAHLNRHLDVHAHRVLPALTEISVPTHTQSWSKVVEKVDLTRVALEEVEDGAHRDLVASSSSGGTPRRAVYYTQDGDTISVVAQKFGIDSHLLLGLNSPLYRGLTLEASLYEGTPIYLKAETAALQDVDAPEENGSIGAESRQPVDEAGESDLFANIRIRSLQSTCFLYYAQENDSPASLSKRFGVQCEDIVRLNEAFHAGLRRGALLRKFTRLYIPWKPDAAIDLSYCFSRLDTSAQPTSINSDMYTCLFVTNTLDSVANICDHLGLNADPVVELNMVVHEDLSASAKLMKNTALFMPIRKQFWDPCLATWTIRAVSKMFSEPNMD